MSYNRFIALGDSMTEGMQDEKIKGNYRGWADRVADVMASNYENFTYANLAIRGKKVGQVLREQVPVALGLVNGPSTIISFHAGANDVIRPKYDPVKTFAEYDQAVRALVKSGATVMLFCVLEDSGAKTRAAKVWKLRFEAFNENVRKIAGEVGAILLDPNQESSWRHPGFIHEDRLHLNSLGHYRVAQAVLARLNLPHDSSWRTPLPPPVKLPLGEQIKTNLRWIILYGIPWAIRRIRKKSSGDGRSPKYPAPTTWKP